MEGFATHYFENIHAPQPEEVEAMIFEMVLHRIVGSFGHILNVSNDFGHVECKMERAKTKFTQGFDDVQFPVIRNHKYRTLLNLKTADCKKVVFWAQGVAREIVEAIEISMQFNLFNKRVPNARNDPTTHVITSVWDSKGSRYEGDHPRPGQIATAIWNSCLSTHEYYSTNPILGTVYFSHGNCSVDEDGFVDFSMNESFEVTPIDSVSVGISKSLASMGLIERTDGPKPCINASLASQGLTCPYQREKAALERARQVECEPLGQPSFPVFGKKTEEEPLIELIDYQTIDAPSGELEDVE